MAYSIQNGQLCTICQDPPFVGKITKTHPSSLADVIVHQGKTLKACGHAFHDSCINKAIFSGLANCPNCRTEIDFSERSFSWIKDPIQPENDKQYERYISINGKANHTVIIEKEISEKIREQMIHFHENLMK